MPALSQRPADRVVTTSLPPTALGILLIHGLGGTPNELRPLSTALRQAGHHVHAIRLPGHAVGPGALAKATRHDWIAALDAALNDLVGRCSRIIVGGLSMGALLALHLAVGRCDDVDALILLAPALKLDGWAMPRHARWLGHVPTALLPRTGAAVERHPYGLKDERVRGLVLDAMRSGRSADAGVFATPMASLAEFTTLSREIMPHLGGIRQPTLIIHPREDDIAALSNAQDLQAKLGGLVETLMLDDSYHLVTVDRQRGLVAEHVCRFADRIAVAATVAALPRRCSA